MEELRKYIIRHKTTSDEGILSFDTCVVTSYDVDPAIAIDLNDAASPSFVVVPAIDLDVAIDSSFVDVPNCTVATDRGVAIVTVDPAAVNVRDLAAAANPAAVAGGDLLLLPWIQLIQGILLLQWITWLFRLVLMLQ